MSSLDPITLQVMIGGLRAACEEMGATLIRSAYSANIKERRDCSTALFDADGELVMQAEHIPVHLGSMPDAVAAVLDLEQRPGEAWISPTSRSSRRSSSAGSCSASPAVAPTTPTSAARPRPGCPPPPPACRTRAS
jgi:hypothetical protein